jgi:hypothetical protein
MNPGDAGSYESFLSNGNHPVQYRNRHRVLKIADTGDISGDEEQVKIIEAIETKPRHIEFAR